MLSLHIELRSTSHAARLPNNAADLDQPIYDGTSEVLRAQIGRVLICAHLVEPKGAAPEMVLNPQLTHCEVSNSSRRQMPIAALESAWTDKGNDIPRSAAKA